jgi:hypothetical protein
MTTSFRPIVELRGTSSSTFVNPYDLEFILTGLVDLAFAGDCSSEDEGNQIVFWIEQGQQLLDYLDAKDVQFLVDQGDGEDVLSTEKMTFLFENMKNLTSDWQSLVQKDGSLTFSIDVY